MRYAIDGSNVLLGLRLNKEPSIRLFCRLLVALQQRGEAAQIFFDNSIRPIMEHAGLQSDWQRLLDALAAEGIAPVFAVRADPQIEKYCREHGAGLISFSDKMDSWNAKPATVHRVRAFRIRSALHVTLLDDATGRFIFNAPAHESFAFGNLRFPSLDPQQVVIERSIARNSTDASAVAEGTLLVLALDASGSMTHANTYDGRPKSTHLNEIVKDTLARLRRSRISEGLYVAVLRFENDVTPLLCPVTNTTFASIDDWATAAGTFDYLEGITPGQTNIRLALQRSKELIQETVLDEESVSALADAWRATVVLITDGVHYVRRPDGSTETEQDIVGAVLQIHMGASDLISSRIDVGCVGIGIDVNTVMLTSIASRCTPLQLKMARTAGISKLLIDERLFIRVDSADPGFSDAIRTFIDVASGSA
jgi:Mg-chelatase subunit ChlD